MPPLFHQAKVDAISCEWCRLSHECESSECTPAPPLPPQAIKTVMDESSAGIMMVVPVHSIWDAFCCIFQLVAVMDDAKGKQSYAWWCRSLEERRSLIQASFFSPMLQRTDNAPMYSMQYPSLNCFRHFWVEKLVNIKTAWPVTKLHVLVQKKENMLSGTLSLLCCNYGYFT